MSKETSKEKTKEKEVASEFKYGVEDLAEALGIKPASVRVQLRNKGVEKAGKSYGWNTKSDLEEVTKLLKTEEKSEKKAEKKPEKKAESKSAPAKMKKKSSGSDKEAA